MRVRRLIPLSTIAVLVSLASGAQGQTPAAPTVSAPVTGGTRGQAFGAWTDKPAGWIEEERFLSGTASAYTKAGTWGVDGQWTVTPAGTSPYAIRLLVRRPADPTRFNGTVIVEWLNVTAQAEGAADFMQMQELIVRAGYVWIGVGAQAVGIHAPRTGLKAFDTERYAPLAHPGDAYSYDIFTQTAQAIRKPANAAQDLLAGLRPRHVIATGRSQSAFRLVTYLNAFHGRTHAFEGYLVHSRGANAAGLTAEALARDAESPIPPGARLRTDIDVPVLDLQTEGDMVTLRSHLTRQDPNPHYRRWEIAGAAHAETPRWVVEVPPPLDMGPGCKDPVNSAPHHAVVKAALQALTRWVRDGVTPPQSPAIPLAEPSAPDPIVRDAMGLATGGIRLPQVDAPTAVITGERNEVAKAVEGQQNFCFLFGRTVPFSTDRLKSLYPSHDAYVERFTRATDALVRDGYLLREEAEAAKTAAKSSTVGHQ